MRNPTRNLMRDLVVRVLTAVSAAVLPAALLLAGCDVSGCTSDCVSVNDGGPTSKGSGTPKTEDRSVAAFSAIRMDVGGRAEIVRTGSASLAVTADDNLLPLFTSEVRDGTLILGVEKGKSLAGKMPVYKITVVDLRRLELKGAGEADARQLDGDSLTVAVAGSAAAKLAGRADTLAITVSGSGACNAGALAAKRATVAVSGSGEVTVNASDALDAKVSGSGSVHYLGTPKLTKSISGSGEVTQKSN
jgi:Putative auto-transporter adhesin, head GIN domain